MVVIDPLEAGQQHLALVHRRVEAQIAIDVGINNEVGRMRDNNLVVDDRNTEWGDQARLLHEGVRAVGLAIAVFVFDDDDAVALGLAGVVGAIADTLGDPNPAVLIDVDVRRVAEQRRRRPERDLKPSGT